MSGYSKVDDMGLNAIEQQQIQEILDHGTPITSRYASFHPSMNKLSRAERREMERQAKKKGGRK